MAYKEWTSKEILDLAGGGWPTCVLQAAVNLEVFTALDKGKDSSGNMWLRPLAQALQCDTRGLGMLITALASLGFLELDGELIKVEEAVARYLSAESPEYLGFIIKHHSHILPAWANLAQAVRTGSLVVEETDARIEGETEREAFLMGMFNVARHQADAVARALDLSGRKRLLDLGGGPGTYAVFFCRHYPDLRATVFDLPTTEKFASGLAARYDLADKIDFVGGDFLADEIPTGFDVAWLSQVLHGEPPEDAARLVKRGAEALSKGGLLCIQEFILDDDRRGPRASALFSLNMLACTPGGQAYTQAEIRAMMEQAGATDIRRLEVQLPPGCGIMVGEL